MAAGERNDPYLQIHFLIEIDDVTVGRFSEVSGLTTETDMVEYREGSDSATVRKIPGLRTYTNLVLKRGWTDNTELYTWRKTVMDGVTERRAGSIIVLNEAREEALRFNFVDGWICKWEGPQLNATTNEVAIESIEICHEGLELVS